MQKIIKSIIIITSLFSMITMPLISNINKAEANFQECSENSFCFFTDIWNGSNWNNDSATNTAGGTAIFNIGMDNRTLTNSGRNTIAVTHNPNLTYILGSMRIHDVDGEHTPDYFGVNETDILTAGIELPRLRHSTNPVASYQIRLSFRINPNLTPGNYSLAVNATGKNTLGTFTNSAVVNVNAALPQNSGLNAKYYSNKYLYGSPVLQRVDPLIDSQNPVMNWSLLGSPGNGVPVDNFSVQWTGQINTQYGGNYTLYSKSDDGIRMWINDQLVIDEWVDRGTNNTFDDSVTLNMAPGWNNIRIEYYEALGGATARLFWSNSSQTGGNIQIVPQQNLRQTYTGSLVQTGLKGEYFDNSELKGSPVLTKIDSSIYFIWGTSEPAPDVPSDHFGIKWTGQIFADHSELYTFCFKTDDGSRMWINGQTVFDDWNIAGFLHESCGTVNLTAGWNLIRLDMFEYNQHNAAMLFWSSPSQTGNVKDNIPTSKLSPDNGPTFNVGLNAEYFNNPSLTGSPALTRVDSNINFDWYMGSPDNSINVDNFSTRWTGELNITQGGVYRFVSYSDNGIRVWIDNILVIDNWNWSNSTRRQETNNVALSSGMHTIRVEYVDTGDAAGVKLFWKTPINVNETILPSTRLSH